MIRDWHACLIGAVLALVIILGCGYLFESRLAEAASRRGLKEPRVQVDTDRGHILVYTFYDVEMGVLCYVHHEGIACVDKRRMFQKHIVKRVEMGRKNGEKIIYFGASPIKLDKPAKYDYEKGRDLYK